MIIKNCQKQCHGFFIYYFPLSFDLVSSTDLSPPRILGLPHRVVKKIGEQLTLLCVASGSTPLQLQWIFKGEQTMNQTACAVLTSESQQTETDTANTTAAIRLQVQRLTVACTGLYTCEARNAAGTNSKNVHLFVEGENLLSSKNKQTGV